MDNYQAGGHKPSHYRTPRVSSDAHWSQGYPAARIGKAARNFGWLGWLAFILLGFVMLMKGSS